MFLPEFHLDSFQFFASQLKELLCLDGFLLVKVASKLKLLFDVAQGVLNVINVIFHLLHLLFSKVLQHLDVVVRATMVFKTLSTQGLSMTQTIVYVIVFMLWAHIVIANDSAVV